MERIGAACRRLLPWALLALAGYLWWLGEYSSAVVLLVAVLPIEKGNRRPDPPVSPNRNSPI